MAKGDQTYEVELGKPRNSVKEGGAIVLGLWGWLVRMRAVLDVWFWFWMGDCRSLASQVVMCEGGCHVPPTVVRTDNRLW